MVPSPATPSYQALDAALLPQDAIKPILVCHPKKLESDRNPNNSIKSGYSHCLQCTPLTKAALPSIIMIPNHAISSPRPAVVADIFNLQSTYFGEPTSNEELDHTVVDNDNYPSKYVSNHLTNRD